MQEYETVFILDPGLDENQVNDEIQKTEALITSHGGTIQEVQRWGRKRLAYEIRRKRDGVYTFIKYESSGEAVKELERRLRLNDNVMRVLSVIVGPEWDIPSVDPDAGDLPRTAAVVAGVAPIAAVAAVAPAEAVVPITPVADVAPVTPDAPVATEDGADA